MWQNHTVGYDPPSEVGRGRGQRNRLARHPVWLAAVAASYVLVTALVLVPSSPLLALDQHLRDLHLRAHHPAWQPWLDGYVLLGQRGPSTIAFLPYFGWLCWRQRSTRPLVLLATALLCLNVSVGVVKYGLGRVGPRQTADIHRYLPLTGTIYPSGHVSNAVVLYGLIAWTAPQWRKAFTAMAAILAVTIGACTIYLRTHWFSDVLGAWLAGALVLLAMPYAYPTAQRWADATLAAVKRPRPDRLRLAPAHQNGSTLPAMAVSNVQRFLYLFVTRSELAEAITRGFVSPTPLTGRQRRGARDGVVWLSNLVLPSVRPAGGAVLLRPDRHETATDVVRITVCVPDAQHWPQWARRHRMWLRHKRAAASELDDLAGCWWVVPRPVPVAEWLYAQGVVDGHRLPIATETAIG